MSDQNEGTEVRVRCARALMCGGPMPWRLRVVEGESDRLVVEVHMSNEAAAEMFAGCEAEGIAHVVARIGVQELRTKLAAAQETLRATEEHAKSHWDVELGSYLHRRHPELFPESATAKAMKEGEDE